jgi:hypothetical protein
VTLYSLALGGQWGGLGCGDDEDCLAGFDVPEHFGEPEVLGVDDHGWLFWVVRLIGVHLFRSWLLAGVVGRGASLPSEPLGGHSSFRILVFLSCGEGSPPRIAGPYHRAIAQ